MCGRVSKCRVGRTPLVRRESPILAITGQSADRFSVPAYTLKVSCQSRGDGERCWPHLVVPVQSCVKVCTQQREYIAPRRDTLRIVLKEEKKDIHNTSDVYETVLISRRRTKARRQEELLLGENKINFQFVTFHRF